MHGVIQSEEPPRYQLAERRPLNARPWLFKMFTDVDYFFERDFEKYWVARKERRKGRNKN